MENRLKVKSMYNHMDMVGWAAYLPSSSYFLNLHTRRVGSNYVHTVPLNIKSNYVHTVPLNIKSFRLFSILRD